MLPSKLFVAQFCSERRERRFNKTLIKIREIYEKSSSFGRCRTRFNLDDNHGLLIR
jgi:hypothetical protein